MFKPFQTQNTFLKEVPNQKIMENLPPDLALKMRKKLPQASATIRDCPMRFARQQ